MATEILAIGSGAANSNDVVIAAGATLTVALKDAEGPALSGAERVDIQLRDDVGQYFRVDTLTAQKPAVVIVGSGTYRFSRAAGASCGVFSG